MPCHTNHQAAIVTPVSRPPFLAIGHQVDKVFLQSIDIEALDYLTVVKICTQRVCFGVVLVKDFQVEGVRPPFCVRSFHCGEATMHDGALSSSIHVVSP